MKNIRIRYAQREECEAINKIRMQVNDIHVSGRPDIFRTDAWEKIKDIVYKRFDEDGSGVIVALLSNEIVGFAQVQYVCKPASPYNLERKFYHVEEFGVDEMHRRMGIATALMEFIKNDAKERGFSKVELDMWQFNDSALAFYEKTGFITYRRMMEVFIDENGNGIK